MTSSLDSQIRHFIGSSHQNFVVMANAISARDWSGVRSLVDRVSELKITASITNLVNSSQTALEEFTTRLETDFPPEARRLLKGVTLIGMGGFALAEAAGFAALFGIAIISAQVVAIALLMWGLSIALPAIWKMALGKLEQSTDSFKDE